MLSQVIIVLLCRPRIIHMQRISIYVNHETLIYTIRSRKSGYSVQELPTAIRQFKPFLLASNLDMYRIYHDSPRYHGIFSPAMLV